MALINSALDGDILTIYFSGRVDSTNASDVGAEVDSVLSSNPHSSVILDVENLEYIASAGLRIVLKIGKMEKDFVVVGANTDVYDVFDMTGFTEILNIKKAYRKLSVDGCVVVGKGAKGTVYRYDPETIIKVYNDNDSLPAIERERELAHKAFKLGIPTAISFDIVKVGDNYGSVFELLDTKSLSEYIATDPENFDKYVKHFSDLLRLIHDTPVKKSDMPNAKDKFLSRLEHLEKYFDATVYQKLHEMISDVTDTDNMLHCDYHTNNVMLQNGEVILIDMDTLSYGNPIFELANIYIAYVGFGIVNHKMVENFIGLPFATTTKIWDKFLSYYLDTDDADKIKDVESKASILALIRFMRHIDRRNFDTEDSQETFDKCKEKIVELLETVDSLDFIL